MEAARVSSGAAEARMEVCASQSGRHGRSSTSCQHGRERGRKGVKGGGQREGKERAERGQREGRERSRARGEVVLGMGAEGLYRRAMQT